MSENGATPPPVRALPWPAADIHALALDIHASAMKLIDDTAAPYNDDADAQLLPTITYEEAIATLALATAQMHSTITNSFTAIAMGLDDNEDD